MVIAVDGRDHCFQALLVELAAPLGRRLTSGVGTLCSADRVNALAPDCGPALVAGPAEVGTLAVVDLLPGPPPHIADPRSPAPRVDGHAERIAQSIGPDLGTVGVRVRCVVERVVRRPRPGQWVDAQYLAGQGVGVLGQQGTRVRRVVIGAVAVGEQKVPVIVESHASDGVGVLIGGETVLDRLPGQGPPCHAGHRCGVPAVVLIADVLSGAVRAGQNQPRTGIGTEVSVCGVGREPLQPRDPTGDRPSLVLVHAGRVIGVEKIHVRLHRELGMDRQPQ